MLDSLCTGLLCASDVTSDDMSGIFVGVFFIPRPLPAPPRSSSGIEGLRKRPPTDTCGLKGLVPIVLLPALTRVILGEFLIGLGDLSFMIEPGPAMEGLDGVALERRFILLLAFKGVFNNFVVVGHFDVISGAKDCFGGLKVLVDARKSTGTTSPL